MTKWQTLFLMSNSPLYRNHFFLECPTTRRHFISPGSILSLTSLVPVRGQQVKLEINPFHPICIYQTTFSSRTTSYQEYCDLRNSLGLEAGVLGEWVHVDQNGYVCVPDRWNFSSWNDYLAYFDISVDAIQRRQLMTNCPYDRFISDFSFWPKDKPIAIDQLYQVGRWELVRQARAKYRRGMKKFLLNDWYRCGGTHSSDCLCFAPKFRFRLWGDDTIGFDKLVNKEYLNFNYYNQIWLNGNEDFDVEMYRDYKAAQGVFEGRTSGFVHDFVANSGDDRDRHALDLVYKQRRAELESLIARFPKMKNTQGKYKRARVRRELREFYANVGEEISFWNMPRRAWTALKTVIHGVESVEDAVSSVKSVVSKFKPHLVHLLGLMLRWKVQAPTMTALAIDLFILAERVNPDAVKDGLASFLKMCTSLASETAADGEEAHSESRNGRSEFHQNSGDDSSLAIGAMMGFLKTTAGGLGPRVSLPFLAKWGRIIKDVQNGARTTLEIIRPCAKMIMDYIRCKVIGEAVATLSLSKKMDVTAFMMEHARLASSTPNEKLEQSFVDAFYKHWLNGIEVRRAIALDPDIPRNLRVQLAKIVDEINKLYEANSIRLQDLGLPVRPTPYCFALVGPSGCGKSDVSMMLLRDMCHPSNCVMDTTAMDFSQLIFCDSNGKHKDNYKGQPCWYRDDLGQKKQTAQTAADECEFSKFINLVSSTELEVDVARIENKGRKVQPRIVAYTANQAYPYPKTVECVEAVQRRRNALIWVTYQKDSNVFPEEGNIQYNIPGEGFVREARLQDTAFYLIPSELRNGSTVVGENAFTDEMKPQHPKWDGEHTNLTYKKGIALSGPMSYVQLLQYLVEEYNKWMGTSNARRLLAPIPVERTGFGGQPTIWQQFRPKYRFDYGPADFVSNNGDSDDEDTGYLMYNEEAEEALNSTMREALREPYVTVRDRKESAHGNFNGRVKPRDLHVLREMGIPDNQGGPETANFNSRGFRIPYLSDLGFETPSFVKSVISQLGVAKNSIVEFCKRHSDWVMIGLFAGVITGVSIALDFIDRRKADPIPEEAVEQFVRACSPSVRQALRYSLMCENFECKKIEMEANMATKAGYGDMKPMRGLPKVLPPQSHPVATAFAANFGLVNNADVLRLIQSNLRTIRAGTTVTQGLGICGKWMLINEHFITHAKFKGLLDDKGYLLIKIFDKSGVLQWHGEISTENKIKVGTDIVVVELPPQCFAFKDIRRHFISERELNQCRSFQGYATSVREGFATTAGAEMHLDCEINRYRGDEDYIEVARAFRGKIEFLGKGDCGAPLIASHLNRICAIHAASDDRGNVMMLPVWRELFEGLRVDFVYEDPTVNLREMEANNGEIAYWETEPSVCNFILDKTNIVESPIHGKVVEVRKAPSVKSLKDPRISEIAKSGPSPMAKSFAQQFDVVRDVPHKIWAKATLAMTAVLMTVQPLVSLGRRLLTEDEVLNGVPGEYVSLNIHTSAGFPQRQYSPLPAKEGFFEQHVKDDGSIGIRWKNDEPGRRFKADYEAYEAQLRQGTVPFAILLEQLKDETLKLGKISDAKTRTFEVFPGPLALVWRKYFGAFIAANQRVCTEKPISVGINAHSIQWKYLYDRLSKFGGKVLAGDYQAWDKKLTGQAILTAVRVINRWYDDGPVNARVREALAEMIIHKYVLIARKLYQTHQGMPSGVPVTAVLNSVCNGLYLFAAIIQLLQDANENISVDELVAEVEMALYGDDHVVALSPRLQKHITFSKLAAYFTDRGVGYTDSAKSSRIDFDFEDLSEITYLKRKFHVVDRTHVHAPLDKVSVEDCLNWIERKNGESDLKLLTLRFDSLKIEAALHGEAYYNDLMHKLNTELRGYEVPGMQALGVWESYEDISAKYFAEYAQY